MPLQVDIKEVPGWPVYVSFFDEVTPAANIDSIITHHAVPYFLECVQKYRKPTVGGLEAALGVERCEVLWINSQVQAQWRNEVQQLHPVRTWLYTRDWKETGYWTGAVLGIAGLILLMFRIGRRLKKWAKCDPNWSAVIMRLTSIRQ